MARQHNSLHSSSSALSSALRKALGLTRPADLERLGETLTPTIDIWGNDLAEWFFLRQEALGAVRLNSAAVAAEFSITTLSNATGSGLLVVVETVSFTNVAAAGCFLEIALDAQALATLAGATSTVARDRRNNSILRSVGRTGTDPSATLGGQSLEQIAATSGEFLHVPVVLRPGDCLAVVGQTLNSAISVNYKFRERLALPGELVGPT